MHRPLVCLVRGCEGTLGRIFVQLLLDDPEFPRGDVGTAYRWLHQEAPVYWCESARLWALSRYADILEVSRNPATFCSGRGVLVHDDLRSQSSPAPAPSIIHMDPPEHNRYRRIVSKAFTPRMVSGLEGRIREITQATLHTVPSAETVNFVDSIAVPIPILVIAEMLGVPAEDRSTFRTWSDAVIASADTGGNTPESMEAVGSVFGYFLQLLATRRAAPGPDLLSALVTAEVEGKHLTDEEILIFCMTLLVAGNETTRNLISGGMHALLQHPDQLATLAQDLSLLPNAIEEMLRWVTPVRCFARTATRETTIGNTKIAAGDYILMLYAAGNRDPQAFGDSAYTFDIRRSPEPMHLAFGFGEHMCLGASLARMEARIVFEEVFRRWQRPMLDGPVELLRSTLMNGVVKLPVSLS
jgi:cytochrome P450